MPSAPNSRAICGKGFFADLYCMMEVREMTFSARIFERLAMRASVMPSAK